MQISPPRTREPSVWSLSCTQERDKKAGIKDLQGPSKEIVGREWALWDVGKKAKRNAR